MDEGEGEEQPEVLQQRIDDRENGERKAADDQDAPLSYPIRKCTGQRRRKSRREGEKSEKQSRRERRSSELEDVERRGRQQLKRGEKYGERESAHHEEARSEEPLR